MKPQVLRIIPHPLTNKSCWRTKPWWFLIKAFRKNEEGRKCGIWSMECFPTPPTSPLVLHTPDGFCSDPVYPDMASDPTG